MSKETEKDLVDKSQYLIYAIERLYDSLFRPLDVFSKKPFEATADLFDNIRDVKAACAESTKETG